MTCSRRVTRTGLATMRNRCGCECITVESPDDAYCVGFTIDDYDFQLYAANGEYSGGAEAVYLPPLLATIVCDGGRLRLTVYTVDDELLVQYDAPSTGCCVPAVFPQTFTRVGDNEDYPATLVLTACETECENPLASDETCEDPVPCAYRIINLCPQFKSIDVTCEVDDEDYSLNAWLLDTVTLRKRCSNGNSSAYFALAPINTYLATANFGNGGGNLALNRIGADWRDITTFGSCVPCSWFDGPSIVFGVGGPPTNCRGGGGAAVEHRYADDSFYEPSGGTAFSPLTAFALDTVAGTLTPNPDLFAGSTAGDTTQPGSAAQWGFPRFPSYTLVDGATWNCRGCNRLKKDESPYPDEPDEWKMPTYIEIVPIWEPADLPCPTGEKIEEPNSGYDSKETRSACDDGSCKCVPGYMALTCGGASFSCDGTFCTGGHVGQESPAGPSREMCCDFTIDGVLRHICLVVYCDGTDWKIDVYCDDVYESTVTATIVSHCPLSFRFTFELECAGCTGCGSLSTTCEPPEPVGPCCDLPDTLHCTIDSACDCFGSASFALTKQLSGRWLSDVITYGGCESTLQVELWCEDGTWHGAKKATSCGADGINDDPFFVTSTNSPAPCDPFIITMISLESVVHPNPCCPTGSVTSTYTFSV